MGDKWWWVWISIKIFFRIFLAISNYQVSDATNKMNVFFSQHSFTSGMFWIEYLMQENEFVVAREFKFEF